MEYHFGEVVQNFELKRVGGAPKGHPLTPLAVWQGFTQNSFTSEAKKKNWLHPASSSFLSQLTKQLHATVP